MKNLFLSLLVGGAATSLIADENPCPSGDFTFVVTEQAHHEINPSLRVLHHHETGYEYTKAVGGIEYNYYRPEGLNFGAYMGYSHSNSKSFFVADWSVKYLFNYTEGLNLYPAIGFSNTSHFSSSTLGDNFQVYTSKLNVGFGGVYNYNDLFKIDLAVHYFKDVASAVILHKGDDFWGKHYNEPWGFKTNVDFIIPNIISKDIVIGAFYAQTVKDCYKEYGARLAVNFLF